ncbi:hypothetical protein CC78DRAFT_549210 [Lojkania enalia]|uniref:Uncharacterized protein n=1 Tax=Lojkania enalia TaxID=147567 RepID=A0A9P4N4I4_9PLEO|nr:hypothetical protein CC78DRAFT_549210 [Didymosphaeria enalia]
MATPSDPLVVGDTMTEGETSFHSTIMETLMMDPNLSSRTLPTESSKPARPLTFNGLAAELKLSILEELHQTRSKQDLLKLSQVWFLMTDLISEDSHGRPPSLDIPIFISSSKSRILVSDFEDTEFEWELLLIALETLFDLMKTRVNSFSIA